MHTMPPAANIAGDLIIVFSQYSHQNSQCNLDLLSSKIIEAWFYRGMIKSGINESDLCNVHLMRQIHRKSIYPEHSTTLSTIPCETALSKWLYNEFIGKCFLVVLQQVLESCYTNDQPAVWTCCDAKQQWSGTLVNTCRESTPTLYAQTD